MRINKYIAQSGYCSRRQADVLVADGTVTINGHKAEPGSQVQEGDTVKVGNKVIGQKSVQKVYIAYHKPVGIMCTTDQSKKDNIIDAINFKQRIFPIGRLDVASSGLILLTNDGEIVNTINKAENKLEKEYLVEVDHKLSDEFIHAMKSGINILDRTTLPAKVQKLGAKKFRIILVQGWNRQIRRMCEAYDYKVKALHRVRVGEIVLGDMKPGQWRTITKNEIGV